MAPDYLADKTIPLKLRTAVADAALAYANACVHYAVCAENAFACDGSTRMGAPRQVDAMVQAMDQQQVALNNLKAATKALVNQQG